MVEPRDDADEVVDWDAQARKMKRNAAALDKQRQQEQVPLTEEQLRLARERRLRDAGFAPRYAEESEWDKMPDVVQAAVRLWLNSIEDNLRHCRGFWMGGASGCGKTMAAAVLADEIMQRGIGVRFMHAVALFDRLVSFRDMTDLWNELVAPRVLIVDDLGREHDAEWPMAKFTWLVEERYGHRAPIIVTSNREPSDFREDASWEAVIGRLGHGAASVWCDGPDQRKEASNA